MVISRFRRNMRMYEVKNMILEGYRTDTAANLDKLVRTGKCEVQDT